MCELQSEAALRAFTTRLWFRAHAQQHLPQEQCESLLANAARAIKEHAGRKRTARDGGVQLFAQSFVAVEF
jgi:hypothetical protein